MAINNSIVDYLNSIGQDSSYAARKKLAADNGIQGYSGTAAQNTSLLKILQNSQNTKNNSGVTAPAAQTGSGVSENVTAGVTENKTSSGFQKSETTKNYQNQLQTMETNKPEAYQPSETVSDYYSRLQEKEEDKPEAYQSQYTAEIDSILNSILGNKEFNYTAEDLAADDLYQMYRENYVRQGDLAMRDTMGNAAALTGGYGSTYASAAGQQAYDNYLAKLNDLALDFADRAYEKYLNQQAERYNQLGAVTGLDNTDYNRYRDTVGDYYNDMQYLAGRYDQEYAKDYGQYRDSVNDYNTDRSYLAGMYDTEYGHDMSEYQTGMANEQWEKEFAFQKALADQEQANWEAEMALAKAKAGGGGSGSNTRAYEDDDESDVKLGGYAPLAASLAQKLSDGEMSHSDAYEAVMKEIDKGNLDPDEAEMAIQEAGIDKAEVAKENMQKDSILKWTVNLSR